MRLRLESGIPGILGYSRLAWYCHSSLMSIPPVEPSDVGSSHLHLQHDSDRDACRVQA